MGWCTLRKYSGSKEYLDWFKIDFNAAKIRVKKVIYVSSIMTA